MKGTQYIIFYHFQLQARHLRAPGLGGHPILRSLTNIPSVANFSGDHSDDIQITFPKFHQNRSKISDTILCMCTHTNTHKRHKIEEITTPFDIQYTKHK